MLLDDDIVSVFSIIADQHAHLSTQASFVTSVRVFWILEVRLLSKVEFADVLLD